MEPPKSSERPTQCSSLSLSLCPPKRQLCPHPSDLVGDSDGEKEAMEVEKEREKGLPAYVGWARS